jgi:hypothetical protein
LPPVINFFIKFYKISLIIFPKIIFLTKKLVIKGKKRLDNDMENIRKTIEGTMKELLFAKE